MPITSLTPQQLRNAADLKERIDALQEQLNALLGEAVASPALPAPARAPKTHGKKGRKLSPQAIANIRAGVAKRMAKQGQTPAPTKSEPSAARPKRQMSAAAKARLSALAKARWRKVKAAGKSKL